jgi:gamma-glutamylcyclotransferase (GGCT)/AIG2-like uncharacterized protein YtfP
MMMRRQPARQHLFVYGTLRSEFPHPLARRLALEARLIGKGSASGTLYALSYYPGAIFQTNAGSQIVGEVYALPRSSRLLAEFDVYEGSLFRRVRIDVRLSGRRAIEAWSYELTGAQNPGRRIEGGDFMQHLSRISPRRVRH